MSIASDDGRRTDGVEAADATEKDGLASDRVNWFVASLGCPFSSHQDRIMHHRRPSYPIQVRNLSSGSYDWRHSSGTEKLARMHAWPDRLQALWGGRPG